MGSPVFSTARWTVPTDQKSNEITAIPRLLRTLDVAGCIITIDVMGTQSAIAGEIRERGGARQDSCHLSHAAKGCLFVLPIAMATTDSRSGLSVTGPAGDQFRVWRDQRAGWRSRASAYSA